MPLAPFLAWQLSCGMLMATSMRAFTGVRALSACAVCGVASIVGCDSFMEGSIALFLQVFVLYERREALFATMRAPPLNMSQIERMRVAMLEAEAHSARPS